MRRGVELLDRPSAASGSHICWSFDEPGDFRAAASHFAAEGLGRGERVLYLADAPEAELPGHLIDLPVERLLDEGRLVVRSVDALYGHDGGFDAPAQVQAFRDLACATVAQGYSGLRVVADTSSLAASEPDRYLAYELLADRFMASGPVNGMCGFASSTPGLLDLFAVHRARSATGPDPLAGAWFEGEILCLAGEIDLTTSRVVDSVIEALLMGDDDGRLDWSDLSFIDVGNLARFDGLVGDLGRRGRRLQVRGAPAVVRRCCEILDLGRLGAALEES